MSSQCYFNDADLVIRCIQIPYARNRQIAALESEASTKQIKETINVRRMEVSKWEF